MEVNIENIGFRPGFRWITTKRKRVVPPIQIYHVKYLAQPLVWPSRFHEPLVEGTKLSKVRLWASRLELLAI
jgi:hypothetical protein